MNIYTLHKEGSFRPPSLECDSEIENSQSAREKHRNPNLQILAEENDDHCSETSDTSGSGHSSSLGEKTTPRQNGTPSVTKTFTYDIRQNGPRVSASRIDATGVITGTNTSQLLPSKAMSNVEPKAKQMLKNSAYSPFESKKAKRSGLIHIQARDEFMIFEDNTDLVSHITTPSAVRTSPLETDFLVFDHEEFAEDDDLFSAITVPKALRKKKSKKTRKAKLKNDGSRNDEQRNKEKEKSDKDKEQEELKLVPSTSTDDTEEEEPQDLPTLQGTAIRRQNSHDLPSNQPAQSINYSGSLRSPEVRGGRRNLPTKEDEMRVTPPMTKEDIDISSQDNQEKLRPSTPTPSREPKEDDLQNLPGTPTASRQLKGVKDESTHDSQQEQHEQLPEEETLKLPPPPSISPKESTESMKPVTSLDAQDGQTSTTSAPIEKMETFDSTPEKSVVSKGQEQGSRKRDGKKKSPKKSSKSAATKENPQAGIKKVSDRDGETSTTSAPIEKMETFDSTPEKSVVSKGQEQGSRKRDGKKKSPKKSSKSAATKENPQAGIKKVSDRGDFAAKAASYGLDFTATTVIDSTALTLNEAGSIEEPAVFGKTPNSHKKGKSLMWWLPTSHFCPQRRKKKHTEETFSMRRTTSVPDCESAIRKQERRNSK